MLSRKAWYGLALSRILLQAVVATLVLSGPVIIGVDHMLERRRRPRIGAAGRFYDPSRRADVAKATSRGLRWISAIVLIEVPFARRIWAELAKVPAAKRWECQRRGCRC